MAHRMTVLRWSLLVAGLGTAMGVSAEPQRRLSVDFDQGQHMKAKGSDAIVDPRSNLTFNATTDKGTKAADRPQVVSKGCFTPPSCLRISMDPSAQGAAKNKIMYSFWSHYKPLPGGEQGRMQIGDKGTTRISFAMKLDQRYDTPPRQMIHFQVFQPAMAGKTSKVKNVKPGGPILSLRMVPLSRRKDKSPDVQEFIIAVRNPQAQNYYYYDTRDKGVLYRGKVRKGEWNRFSFVLQSADERGTMQGRIGFWQDGQKQFDRPVQWGFNPATYAVSPKLGVELGSYRSADAKGHQTVYFDDVTIDR